MAEQLKIAREISQSQIGRTVRVLVEKQAGADDLKNAAVSSWEHGLLRSGEDSGHRLRAKNNSVCFVARGEADAPDIDGRIYINGEMRTGEFAQVKIVGSTDYDLI